MILLVCSLNSNSSAQSYLKHWTKVTIPAISRYITPYFINESYGFIYASGGYLLFRTTDGGLTWLVSGAYTEGSIRHVYFTSASHGYKSTSNGIFETIDSGATWVAILRRGKPGLDYTSVYATHNMVFAYELGPVGPNSYLYRTSNNGLTWDTLLSSAYLVNHWMLPYVFGNKDSLVLASTYDSNGYFYLNSSSDLGMTWESKLIDSIQSFNTRPLTTSGGLFCIPHCDIVLHGVADQDGDSIMQDIRPLRRSINHGTTWDTVIKPSEDCEWVSGNGCFQYLCSASEDSLNGPRFGIYRSTNHGISWKFIDGPDFTEIDDERDYRNLSIVGGGAVIYATNGRSSSQGDLWKTTDGGDGTLSAASLRSKIGVETIPASNIIDTLYITTCDSSSIEIVYNNLNCNLASLNNLTINGLKASEYRQVLSSHRSCDDISDTLRLTMFPIASGKHRVAVVTQHLNDEYESIDTTVYIILNKVDSAISTLSLYTKSFDLKVHPGDTIDIPLFWSSTSTSLDPEASTAEITYSFDTTMLLPLYFKPLDDCLIVDTLVRIGGKTIVRFHFSGRCKIEGEKEIGVLRCFTYLTDSLMSDIYFNSIGMPHGCISFLSDSNSIHLIMDGCGSQILSGFLRNGAVPQFTVRSNADQSSVIINSIRSEIIEHVVIYNSLGKVVLSQHPNPSDATTLSVNTGSIPNGVYYLRIAGNGYATTRLIMLLR
jgi:hypothetical protein